MSTPRRARISVEHRWMTEEIVDRLSANVAAAFKEHNVMRAALESIARMPCAELCGIIESDPHIPFQGPCDCHVSVARRALESLK